MATITVGAKYAYQDNGNLELVTVITGTPTVQTSTQLSVVNLFNYTYNFLGSGVTYDPSTYTASGLHLPTGGVINEIKVVKDDGTLAFDITGLNVSAAAFATDLTAFTNAEQSAYNLLIAGNDTFVGGPGNDRFNGAAATNVTAQPNGGDDILTGGSGVNTLVLTGKFSNYTIAHPLASSTTFYVTDTRAGSPDGYTTANNFQLARFADMTVPLGAAFTVVTGANAILLTDPSTLLYNGQTFAQYANAVNAAALTNTQIDGQLVLMADATTSVATMTYDFFTRYTPTEQGMQYLVSPTGGNPNNLNSAYYSQFSTTNRYINFASSLGKPGGEGNSYFSEFYATLSLTDATSKAYAAIFGSTPTADKVNHLLNDLVPNGAGGTYARENYFAFYGGDGLTGIGTKAAMVGWLIAQADSAHVGTLETANAAYLMQLASGGTNPPYSVDLVGTYHGVAYTGS